MLLFAVTILTGIASCKSNAVQAERTSFLPWHVRHIRAQQDAPSSYCRINRAHHYCNPCFCVDDLEIKTKFYCDCYNNFLVAPKRDCLEYYQAGLKVDGLYMITLNNLELIQVYCDQTTDGGGWTVIQRRIDGSVNFNVNWQRYKDGFGSVIKEFWLGNQNIFSMSYQDDVPKGLEARVDLTDWNDKKYYAKYDQFAVGSELTKYQLHVSGFSGTAGDSLTKVNGQKFSTYDSDNDAYRESCALRFTGGMWFNSCHAGHPNGIYYKHEETVPYGRGISWLGLGGDNWVSPIVQQMEIKVRRKV